MKSTERFWKENEAFFRTSFRDGEDVLYIEELLDGRLSDFLLTMVIYLMLFIIAYMAPLAISVILAFVAVYFTACMFVRMASGAFRRCFFVFTTHSIYYCRGLRGIVVFEWPCSVLKSIVVEKGILTIISSEDPGDVGLAFSGGIPPIGVRRFCKNIFSRIFRKPLLDAIYSATGLGHVERIDEKMYAKMELSIKDNSNLYNELQKLRELYPQIEFKQVKLKPIKEVWPF